MSGLQGKYNTRTFLGCDDSSDQSKIKSIFKRRVS